MAGYNEIQHGRINRYLQRWSGIKGRAPVSSLQPEVASFLQLEAGVEDFFPQTIIQYGCVGFPGAQAAANSGMRLRNPAGSNVLAVVRKIRVYNSPTVNVAFRLTQQSGLGDLTPIVAPVLRAFDLRAPSTPTLIPSISTNTSNLTAILDEAWNSAQNVQVDFIRQREEQIPLLPNDAIQVTSQVVNQAIVVTFWWTERFMEEPERT